jgi:hypothetical protein
MDDTMDDSLHDEPGNRSEYGSDQGSDQGSEHLKGCTEEHGYGERCCINLVHSERHFDSDHPPEIHPPPPGSHPDCKICGENYYTVKAQQNAISNLRKQNKFCTLYKGPFINDEEAQKSLNMMLEVIADHVEYLKTMLNSHGDLIGE